MKRLPHSCWIALALCTCVAGQEIDKVDFPRQILPILSSKCFVCHGPDTQDESLVRLDSFQGATSDLGGFRAIDPDDLPRSELLRRIQSIDDPMPPEDAAHPLSEAEKTLLGNWIEQGGQYAKHWALETPKKTSLPLAPKRNNPIDRFIGQQLDERGIPFAEPASRATLARRVALVLTGLPPEPELLQTYLDDTKSDAYETLVDALLDSSRFGEHQARYWLDAVRYGDTHGLHLDNRRGIFPYRDWVVKAYNDNLPMDDFITWQLAGDLLDNPKIEQLVATGFVRLNPTTGEGGAIPEEFQAKNNFDRVETFGTVFLAQSLTCARCHTHKYDPIAQRDYYRLMAFFNSTAEPAMDRNAYEYGNIVRAPSDQTAWSEWGELESAREKLLKDAEEQIATLERTEAEIRQWNQSSPEQRLALLADRESVFGNLPTYVYAQVVHRSTVRAQQQFTTTLIAKDLAEPRPTHLLQRGEYNLPQGDPLTPGVPNGMGPFPKDAPNNRLGLAQWLVSPQNPLTSRVMVNQIWQRVFGHGLVRTPEDFGVMGQQPTHPDLLDWLAVELQQTDWDLKALMKQMVTSQTFRQNSGRRQVLDDPENKLFARGPSYRLDAEVLRDLGLWASQLLDPTMGGEGVKPYQPPGMWLAMAHPGSNTKNYVADSGNRLYRRSLYVYWKRSSPHPMMTLFDAPSREASCVRRSPTNTPLQSLAMMNETQRVEMARTLAERLIQTEPDNPQRLDHVFRLLACREPTETERVACQQLLTTMLERYEQDPKSAEKLIAYGDSARNTKIDPALHAAWTQVSITLLASDIAILLY